MTDFCFQRTLICGLVHQEFSIKLTRLVRGTFKEGEGLTFSDSPFWVHVMVEGFNLILTFSDRKIHIIYMCMSQFFICRWYKRIY